MVARGAAAQPVIAANLDARLRFNCKKGNGHKLHLYRNPSLTGSRRDNDETGVTGEISGSMRKFRRIAARNPLCHNHFHGELVAAGLASEP